MGGWLSALSFFDFLNFAKPPYADHADKIQYVTSIIKKIKVRYYNYIKSVLNVQMTYIIIAHSQAMEPLRFTYASYAE